VWGVYQGVLLILHKEYSKLLQKVGLAEKLLSSRVYHVLSIIVTFHIVCIGWVIFRADDMNIGWTMIQRLLTAPAALLHFSVSQLQVLQIRDPIIFPALVAILPALMVSHVVVNWLNDKKIYKSPPWALQVGLMVAMMCLLT